MNRVFMMLLISGSAMLLAGRTPVGAVEAPSPDRNYQVIIDRNPFGLKPPPPPPTNAPPVVETKKDDILLTGITSIGGLKAYFMTKPPQGKQPEYYTMSAHETQDGLEVLDIDPSNKSVRVRHLGNEILMTFASNGVKPPATPATGPGAPGPVPGGVAVPGVTPVPAPPAVNMGGPGSTPATGNGRIRQIPSRNVRTPPTFGGSPTIEPNQPVSRADPNAAAQDVLMMELQKRANPNIPFPPTPMPP